MAGKVKHMPGNIWVYVEFEQGQPSPNSLEILGKALVLAGELGSDVEAIVAGHGISRAAGELIGFGVRRVYLYEHEMLEFYQPLVTSSNIAFLAREKQPVIFLLPASVTGSDLAARVAAKLETGLTAHCVDLYLQEFEGQKVLVQVLPGWGGNFTVQIVCPRARPQMATVKQGLFPLPQPAASVAGELERRDLQVNDADLALEIIEEVEEKKEEVDLEGAEVVVCGGWGLRSAGSFDLVEELARACGGASAGTRPAVDAGWVEEKRMIGVSGKIVRPRLFISAGASGAPHYTAGFDKAEIILAIDQIPEAPVFSLCDVGIVGDLRKIIPELISEIKATAL